MGQLTPALRGHAAMLAFSALVAGSFSLGAQVANEITPLALNAVRFWLAAGVICVALLLSGQLRRGALRAGWRYAVLGGLFGAYFVLMFEGLKTAPPVSAAAVFTLTPAITAVFGWVLLRQVTTPRMAFALALAGCGALWVIFRADFAALRAFDIGRGEAIYFVGCVCHALYTPLVRKLNRGEPVLVFTLGTLVGGGVLLSLLGLRDIAATDWGALPALVWITLVYLACFASAASVWLLQTATLRLPSAKVMAYTNLVPSWVILWEAAQGRPLPPLAVWFGVALTIVALMMLLRDETPVAVKPS
ncbi:MAG: DMT family transporter [Roseobacter sp.]|jgi:drug/metabolite transporter (DMT)-like permease|nr:DMT family transporter [Roseobacter sp.]